MRVFNESVVPSELLVPILRRVAQQAGRDSRNCFVLFTSEDEDGFATKRCVVSATAFHNGGWRRELRERHYVRVVIPRTLFCAGRFPHSSHYMDSADAPTHRFETWHEEVAETIAHELRHIHQFANGWVPDPMHDDAEVDTIRAEVDAEQFGAEALATYRTWQPRYLPEVNHFQPAARAA